MRKLVKNLMGLPGTLMVCMVMIKAGQDTKICKKHTKRLIINANSAIPAVCHYFFYLLAKIELCLYVCTY